MDAKSEKRIERVTEAAGPLTPEEAAAAAAELLALAGVSRETLAVFYARLDRIDFAELVWSAEHAEEIREEGKEVAS